MGRNGDGEERMGETASGRPPVPRFWGGERNALKRVMEKPREILPVPELEKALEGL